jgi:hypothetical protein
MLNSASLDKYSGSITPRFQPYFLAPRYAKTGGNMPNQNAILKNTDMGEGCILANFSNTAFGLNTRGNNNEGEIVLSIIRFIHNIRHG